MKARLAFLSFATLIALAGCSISSTPNNNHLDFKGARLGQLVVASQAAAHCGGYVVIDVDDREVLVAHCRK